MGKCKPRHDWRAPRPGESQLECMTCDRVVDRNTESTSSISAAIVNSVERHRGQDEAEWFMGFFGYGPHAEKFREGHESVNGTERRRRAETDAAHSGWLHHMIERVRNWTGL